MNLFEKVKDFRDLNEKVKKLDEEIRKEILTKFVNLRYQIKQIEAGYEERREEETRKVKVYYPVLDLPEGFSKKDEKFFRQFANQIVHTYTLINEEGEELKVSESASFGIDVYENKGIRIRVEDNIFVGNILYEVSFQDIVYKLSREINLEEKLGQLLGKKEIRFICSDIQKLYQSDEQDYEEYLKAFGKTEDIISLKELLETAQDEIQITPELIAKISISMEGKNQLIWLETPKISARINKAYCIKNVIQLQLQTKTGIKLDSKEFNYFELKDKDKFEKGMTLQELFEMYC